MAALLVGVEKISSMISRCRIYESMYLEKHSSDQSIKNLQSALVAAYALIQDFLLIAHRLYSKRSTGRAFHAMVSTFQSMSLSRLVANLGHIPPFYTYFGFCTKTGSHAILLRTCGGFPLYFVRNLGHIPP